MNNETNKQKHFLVELQPVGRRIQIPENKSLLEAAQLAGVDITSICGGIGICGSCKVRLMQGELSSATIDEQETFTEDELHNGYRLACQAYPQSDVIIDVPPESLTTPQRLQLEGQQADIPVEPAIRIIPLEIPIPSITDLRSDFTRLKDAIGTTISQVEIEYPLLTSASPLLRDANWNIKAIFNQNKLISILPNQPPAVIAGLAVDVGTTKVAAYLVNLENGDTLAQAGMMNPQIAFGEDVISRISYAIAHPENGETSGRKILQERIVEGLNKLIQTMLEDFHQKNTQHVEIVDAVVVGNTAMHHLFGGFPVQQLGMAPYVPAVSEAVNVPAREIGLQITKGGLVYLPPNIAGYVGADHVAMLLATLFQYRKELAYSNKTVVALDIGTNTEISLLHNRQIYSCSTASGPAFEGAHIQFGMRAAPGAIERVQISKDGQIHYKTIADQPPVGICGSGILDVIAEMYYANILDEKGMILNHHPRVRKTERLPEFILATEDQTGHHQAVVITRRDINEIQLAKGAIRAGIEILLKEANIQTHDIDEFIVAGAFGTYIDIRNAMRIGMFPTLPAEKVHQVGNAAGTGARYMLLSQFYRDLASRVANEIHYVELSNHPKFTEEFSKSLFFPKKDLP